MLETCLKCRNRSKRLLSKVFPHSRQFSATVKTSSTLHNNDMSWRKHRRKMSALQKEKQILEHWSKFEEMSLLRNPQESNAHNKRTLDRYMSQIKEISQKRRDFREVFRVIQQCKKDDCEPDLFFYSACLSALCKCYAPLSSALVLLDEMCSKGFKPNEVCATSLLQFLVRDKRWIDCILLSHILFDIDKEGQKILDFSGLFEIVEKLENDKKKLKILRDQVPGKQHIRYTVLQKSVENSLKKCSFNTQGIPKLKVNKVSVNIILRCLGKAKEHIDCCSMFEWLKWMSVLDLHLGSSNVTFNTVLDCLADRKETQRCISFFQWWVQQQSEKIKKITTEEDGSKETEPLMVHSDFPRIDTVSINSVLKAHASQNDWNQCLKLFDEYFESGQLTPTIISFTELFGCASRFLASNPQNVEHLSSDSLDSCPAQKCLELLDQMKTERAIKDHQMVCHLSVMSALFHAGRPIDALNLFEQVRNQLRRTDLAHASVYSLALRCLFQLGCIEEALTLFDYCVQAPEEGLQASPLFPYLLNVNHESNAGWSKYSMDLHGFELPCGIIAILYNLRQLCQTVSTDPEFKLKPLLIVTGIGIHSERGRTLLKEAVPKALGDSRLFSPPLKCEPVQGNPGCIQIQHESLFNYISQQTGIPLKKAESFG